MVSEEDHCGHRLAYLLALILRDSGHVLKAWGQNVHGSNRSIHCGGNLGVLTERVTCMLDLVGLPLWRHRVRDRVLVMYDRVWDPELVQELGVGDEVVLSPAVNDSDIVHTAPEL